MPRNVRNFWIEIEVDGRKERIATGPRRADGGFDMKLLMRNSGGIMEAMRIAGRHIAGELELVVMPTADSGAEMMDNELVVTTAR